MFCSECGCWVRQSYAYCPGCGKQLGNLEDSPVSNINKKAPQSAASAANGNHSFLGRPEQDPGSSTTPTVAAPSSNPLKRPLTFELFNVKKSEEKQGLSFKAGKSKSKSKANKHSHHSGGVDDVTINIGIMVAKLGGKVDPVRGKGLPLKIKKTAKSDEVLQAAIKKTIDFDRSFDGDYL